MKLKIEDLVLDAGTQIRAELDQSTVAEYSAAYTAGEKFPPVVVFSNNGSPKILADGFHRVEGAKLSGMESIEVELRKGDRPDAMRYALSANAKHGLRRTNADKARAVIMAAREFPNLTNQDISKLVKVSDDCVRSHRPKDAPSPAINHAKKPAAGPPPKPPTSAVAPPAGPPTKASPDAPARSAKPAEKGKKSVRKDSTGFDIPEEIIALWDDSEVQGQLSAISTMRGILRAAEQKGDIRFTEVNFSETQALLDQLYVNFKLVKPHAVCPSCSGLAAKDCTKCKGRGFVSEFYWNNCIPEEIRLIRAKATAS